jgi:hypothetical protein
MATTSSRIRYLLWAASRFVNADKSCPSCKESKVSLLRRKYGVTSLYGCHACHLMYRVPKPKTEECVDFYQSEYEQGFTTDCPAPEELKRLTDCSFAGTPKDYSGYIDVLRAIPLKLGSTIFDFGSSWGYGSWQLARAGYRVYSHEISRPRARYAAEMLACNLFSPEDLPEKVDCLFSSHVIEHLNDPRQMWEVARNLVKPGGVVVLFLPNGDPSRERLDRNYHKHWGQVHPLLISPLALRLMSELYGFTPHCYTSPYNLQQIAVKADGDEAGAELLVVASL